MSEWQAIETAPKVHLANLLLLVQGEPWVGSWVVSDNNPDRAGWVIPDMENDGWMFADPTHWAPIPDLPESA